MTKQTDFLEYFKLKPIKAAKVSEVSEATASSNVPVEERVNFHIGNPAQDISLSSAYLRLAVGIDIKNEDLTEDKLELFVEKLGHDKCDKTSLEFILNLIKKSAPYMPRGGFNKKDPNYLIKSFVNWLIKEQQEPLSYDLGETSGRREIILSSGGIDEALRLLLHSLNNYLITKPIKIFLYSYVLPEHLLYFPNLKIETLPIEEKDFLQQLINFFNSTNKTPAFLVLGKNTQEKTRRILRELSLKHPLFFVEVNDAPNHLSLAREAKMENRVLRFLTAGIFSPLLKDLATVFIAGNADFVKVIENMQFQLKGTPSASEVELLSYILKENLIDNKNIKLQNRIIIEPAFESSSFPVVKNNLLQTYTVKFENKLNTIINDKTEFIDEFINKITKIENSIANKSEHLSSFFTFDKFAETDSFELLNELVKNINSIEWINELRNSFLFSFIKHHPEYNIENCSVVSGSSRTALGILGFHCGIDEVVIPDLSWTYEHCFPTVSVVPLTDKFQLDVDAIINLVNEKIINDSNWINYGVVAINNPHNATGQEFDKSELKRLLTWLLERNINVIDDLSYQNVAPIKTLMEIKTLRQLSDELTASGYITSDNAKHIISIHSLSKTDSYAGARLTVAEIRDEKLFNKFSSINNPIKPNLAAMFLAYLFYRNKVEDTNAYWCLRNRIFFNRMNALEEAVSILPKDRNKFEIKITAPKASMYPQMTIEKLPAGLSLDWLASGLARQGIGLVPLSTFARTEKGFETGRKTFRLTIGGTDNEEVLLKKTRRVLIDLNRMIAEEEANYNKKQFTVKPIVLNKLFKIEDYNEVWDNIEKNIIEKCTTQADSFFAKNTGSLKIKEYENIFSTDFLPDRLKSFKLRFFDRLTIMNELAEIASADKGKSLIAALEKEFYKDNIERREKVFKQRLYDRTVHPTQMYSLKVELLFEQIIENLLKHKNIGIRQIEKTADELIKEFIGLNVTIVSSEEPSELLLDLKAIITAENYFKLHSNEIFQTFLSFWGDWDGSNRPSGQGHSLVAAVLIENVLRQAKLVQLLLKQNNAIKINPNLVSEIEKLPDTNKRFSNLLSEITTLTHQLEKRIRGILPYNLKPGKIRKIGMKLHLAKDPITSLWKHNDRLESKMLVLRNQRKNTLEYYFSLNKQLRKTLSTLLPEIQNNINNHELFIEACLYKDLLKRFIVTPRIHQKNDNHTRPICN